MDAECEGLVLLVGDGDFSFTLSLLNHSRVLASQVTTSNLETEETIKTHSQAASNMADIVALGGSVYLETDARELHNHPAISLHKYERIIFNFPLVDRHHIKKNRALLADFFASCGSILSEGGQVMVTLCKGQGGTPADKPLRSWHNSWQVVAQAATSGFILSDIQSFDASKFPEYHCVGFRFQEKSFDTSGSLTHVFEKIAPVEATDTPPRSMVAYKDATYSCSSYVAHKRKRFLLNEPDNPVNLVCQGICSTVSQHVAVKHLEIQDDFLIMKGHRSKLTIKLKDGKDWPDLDTSMDCSADELSLESTESSTDIKQSEKDRKDELNMKQKRLKTSEVKPDLVLSHGILASKADDHRHLVDEPGCEVKTTFSCLDRILSSDVEAVYSAIKSVPDTPADPDTVEPCQADPSLRVFHLRTSLLEVVGDLLAHNVSHLAEHETVSERGDENQQTTSCLMFTGQSYHPCDISPQCLPVRHELLMAGKVSHNRNSSSNSAGDNPDKDSTSLLSKVVITINNSHLCKDKHSLKLQPEDGSCSICIEGVDDITNLTTLDIHNKDNEGCLRTCTVGLSFLGNIRAEQYEICLINLDLLASSLCRVPDLRLLWSESEKFSRQFNASNFPQLYRPFSLYPMKFVHDLSFWVKESEDEVDERELCDAIRCTVADTVVKLEKMDSSYVDPATGRRSFYYRFHFMSLDSALPYSTSWKLQSEIRMEVARRLGVILR